MTSCIRFCKISVQRRKAPSPLSAAGDTSCIKLFYHTPKIQENQLCQGIEPYQLKDRMTPAKTYGIKNWFPCGSQVPVRLREGQRWCSLNSSLKHGFPSYMLIWKNFTSLEGIKGLCSCSSFLPSCLSVLNSPSPKKLKLPDYQAWAILYPVCLLYKWVEGEKSHLLSQQWGN